MPGRPAGPPHPESAPSRRHGHCKRASDSSDPCSPTGWTAARTSCSRRATTTASATVSTHVLHFLRCSAVGGRRRRSRTRSVVRHGRQFAEATHRRSITQVRTAADQHRSANETENCPGSRLCRLRPGQRSRGRKLDRSRTHYRKLACSETRNWSGRNRRECHERGGIGQRSTVTVDASTPTASPSRASSRGSTEGQNGTYSANSLAQQVVERRRHYWDRASPMADKRGFQNYSGWCSGHSNGELRQRGEEVSRKLEDRRT